MVKILRTDAPYPMIAQPARNSGYDACVRFAGLALCTILLAGSSSSAQDLATVVYASGFTSPVAVVQDSTDAGVQFVVEQGGRIRVIQNGLVLPTDFLNIDAIVQSGGEEGLLGMALAPNYASSRRFFLYYTDNSGNLVIARFVRSANPLVADATSRVPLRWGGAAGLPYIPHPGASNHNGGQLTFGPDGYLYIGVGDGGGANDAPHNAQNPSQLLGKMLRINTDVPDGDGAGYVVPSDNPFVGNPAVRPEIWSFGLRNPWRFSFDDPAPGGSGALLIGDVGQNAWEEINYEPPATGGRNYGWRNREGAHDNVTSRAPAFLPLRDPIHEYSHNDGRSVTGGYVYRGRALGARHRGRYFFADFYTRVWSFAITVLGTGEGQATDLREHTAEFGGGPRLGFISGFGLDSVGELFLINWTAGTILRVIGPAPTPAGLRIIP
jgi:glucose/arabinose dehydrogenase